MDKKTRSNIAVGVFLILIGALTLAYSFIPSMKEWVQITFDWPLFIVGFGVFLFLLGLLVGNPEMATPAAVFWGIGGLLYWQNETGNWESWAYVWSLIPGFAGIGIILTGLITGKISDAIKAGIWPIIISAILFLIFGSFLGGLDLIGPYWPVFLILLGLYFILRMVFQRK